MTRRKLVVAITYPVSPPRGGGQSRVFHLYRELSRSFDVDLICLADADRREEVRPLSDGFREHIVPKSDAHHRAELAIGDTVGRVPITDIVAGHLIGLTPRFAEVLNGVAQDAHAVVASHPYFATLLREHCPSIPLWFEAHNVEEALKREILPAGPDSDHLIEWVRDEERTAWREACVVFACTRADLAHLARLHGERAGGTFEVPNGFSDHTVGYTDPTARRALKARLGWADRPVVLFVGSWHGPNLEAVSRIVEYASAMPRVTFVVAGSVGHAFESTRIPANVRRVGVIDDDEKQVLLASADLAINPMTTGSGSNLKMLDYFAAGVPVLSTPFGARGIDALPGVHYVACGIHEFADTLGRLVGAGSNLSALAMSANGLARRRYTWRAIANRLTSDLAPAHDSQARRPSRSAG